MATLLERFGNGIFWWARHDQDESVSADAMEEFGDAGWQPLAISQPSASGGKQVESWADARTNDRCGGPADTQVFG